ncbi:glutamine cyclotransferase [Chromatium okenii]|uniref:glutaminyl-peptide cyclotransferase n=1 Tax=Chromatium okenii TaxID=61644 RepID=UPI001905378D|nr:glutaminyl-peptide cyclotransferase [Chromatium okenii]MBK1641934.1 glutamine cyclotransferase [Chromatium okenii]
MKRQLLFVTALYSILCAACLFGSESAPIYGYRIVASFPHDPAAFTQGLLIFNGQLFESIGLYGHSALRRVDLTTGRIEQETRLPADCFGEGIAIWRDDIVQLTWREQRGLIYARTTLQPRASFTYSGEGWGITSDGTQWIISDGSAELRFFEPTTRREVRRVLVRDGEQKVMALNELEWVAGEVWANIWQQERIARIDPATGAVVGWLDLRGLRPLAARRNPDAVLNGIAYDAASGRLFVTGKYWPQVFEITLIPPPRS